MASYIIATREPKTQKLMIIADDEGNAAEFKTKDQAWKAAGNTTVCKAWGAEIMRVEFQ